MESDIISPEVVINCDGGSRGNPGPAAAAFTVSDGNGKIFYEAARKLGESTNNRAEYEGVLMALRWLQTSEAGKTVKKVTFLLDSLLVVNQLSGLYKIKDQNLLPLAQESKGIQTRLQSQGIFISFHHVPRSENARADMLVNRSLDSSI